MTTKKTLPKTEIELTGKGVLVTHPRAEDDARRTAQLLKDLRGNSLPNAAKAAIAEVESRLGLEPGAIGTTHAIDEEGRVLDGEGRVVGLTAANPGGIANGSKLLLLDYLFGAVAPAAAAATYYVGLVTGTYTGGTSDISLLQGTFTANPEVTTGAWTNYARVGLANTIAAATWAAATAAAATQVTTKANAGVINFSSNATVTGTGPTPTGWFICTVLSGAPTAAQMIATGNLTSGSVAVVNGAAVSFAVSALSILLT